MRKKLFTILSLSFIGSIFIQAQIYSPGGDISATTNPSTGNIGIGTNTPQAKLTVLHDGSAGSNQLELRTAHLRNPDRYFMKNVVFGAGSDDVTFSLRHDGQMYVGGNTFVKGNVGIGTSSPRSYLELYNKTSSNDHVGIIRNDNSYNLDFYSVYNGSDDIQTGSFAYGVRPYDDAWQIWEKGTRAIWNNLFSVLKNGNIGIGIEKPTTRLEVSSGIQNDSGIRLTNLTSNSPITPNAKLLGIDASGKVVLADSSNGGAGNNWSLTGNSGTNPSANFIGTTDNQPLVFKTNNSEVMRIGTNGNVQFGFNNWAPVANPLNVSLGGTWGTSVPGSKNNLKLDLFYNSNRGNDRFGFGISDRLLEYQAGEQAGHAFFVNQGTRAMDIASSGKIGIGTFNFSCTDCSNYRLFVKDGIKAERVKVEVASANGWADYVFKKDYPLMPLSEVEKHIQDKGHLPNIPSADEVIKTGLDLGAMDAKLLEKIEELTLYSIEQQKRITELEEKVNKLLNQKSN